MNVSVYLEEPLVQQMQRYINKTGISRSAIIREAVSQWLSDHDSTAWPKDILAFNGVSDFPPFEQERDSLSAPSVDPLK